ncbi:OST-HTH/LOTUS domain-containing protein [Rhizobium lusitanum]|nr:OST-HTH/LOTUS domain-containing protein [Rhizobium lusitanum]
MTAHHTRCFGRAGHPIINTLATRSPRLLGGRNTAFPLKLFASEFTNTPDTLGLFTSTFFGGLFKRSRSFRQACRRFFYTENLLPGKAKDEESAVSADMPLQPPSAAVSLIKKVLSQEDAEDGWVSLGTVGKQVLNLAPDFDPRTFGFKKLSDLVRKTNQFEVQQGEGGPIRIRMKRAAGK